MTDATSRWTGLRKALQRRDYRLFVAGQLVSLIGTWTQSVAQSWLVYRLTGSAFWLGIATFCQQAPVFLLATLGGLLADRHRRRLRDEQERTPPMTVGDQAAERRE